MNIDLNKIFQSKKIKMALVIIGLLIALLLVFQAGMAIGFRKANFSFKWGENYHRNFGGPRGGFMMPLMGDFMGRDFINSHGVFGSIIKIDGSTVVIKGTKDMEKIILLKNDTAIMRLREEIKPADLKIDDQIVVIGSPSESGQIGAKLIRVMPASRFPAPIPMMRQR